MRTKNIGQAIIFSLSIINIPQVDQLKDLDPKIQNTVENAVNSNTATVTPLSYKDANLQVKSTSFAPGEKMYISLNSQATGSVINECWLLNSNKDRVTKINLTRSGDKPYTYKGEVSLPQSNGIYYIDLNIKDGSVHTAVQQSIEIGSSGEESSQSRVNSQVSAQSVSQTNITNASIADGISPTPIVYKNTGKEADIDIAESNTNPITIFVKNIIKMIIDNLFVKG